jgi:hypothetical protein
MNKWIVIILLLGSVSAEAQFTSALKERSFLGFFRIRQPAPDLRWLKPVPVLTNFQTDQHQPSSHYWQGVTYTSFSENGRFRSTHSFDNQGVLRESRASFSLKKSGALSWWRIQFSPQRSRPLFVYTIH